MLEATSLPTGPTVTPEGSIVRRTTACWRKSAVVSTQPASAKSADAAQDSIRTIENRRSMIEDRKSSSTWPFSMEHRQIPIGHLEDNQRHRRRVILPRFAVP